MSTVTAAEPQTSPTVHRKPPPRPWSAGRTARIAVMVVIAGMFVYPIIGFIAMAFRSESGIENGTDGFLGLGGVSIRNAINNWNTLSAYGPGHGGVFQQWLVNSVIVAVGGSAIAVVTALPAGFAMARLRWRGRKFWLIVTLIAMAMPNTVLVIPIFLQVDAIGAVGQLWPVAVLMGFFPFGVYLSYIHFLTAMPYELVEAARVDGLGEAGTFFRVALPISKQAVALVTFFSFVANWTNFFLPLTLLTSNQQHKVLAIGLQELIGSSPMFNPTTAAGLTVKLWMPELAFATFISMLPLLVVFIAAQRFLIRGQTVGAVKG